MSTWQPGGPVQEWEAAPPPQPWGQQPPPAPAPAWPLPPAAVWVAGAAAAATAVLLLVLLATGRVADVLDGAGVRSDDAAVLAGVLGVLAVAGLLAGAVGIVTGHGGGLLRGAGTAVAVVAVLAVVAAAVVGQRVVVPVLVFGLVVALLAGGAAGISATAPARTWTAASERRSAERAIAGFRAGRTVALPARGIAPLTVSLGLVAVVVLAGVLTVGELAPDVAAEPAAAPGLQGGAAPVPVEQGDPEWSPSLDRLAQQCAAGDLAGCDELYFLSDEFGDYEQYGSTCGGRAGFPYAGTCEEDFD